MDWAKGLLVRHERTAAIGLAMLLVVARSAVFVFWEQAAFDADQAVMGLMAKHIVEGRAFPVFTYGQQYILGVEAWLAAPLFFVAGPSVAALKLPLLAINAGIAALLVLLLHRHLQIRPWLAFTPALFFILPPPGTAAALLEAGGGNVEPFLYVLLLWLSRDRPATFGAILAIGFLHRPFTIYGVGALLLVEAADRSLFSWRRYRDILVAAGTFVLVSLAVGAVNRMSSALGPGTSLDDLPEINGSLVEIGNRACVSLADVPIGLARLVTVHWPLIFGWARTPLRDLGIVSLSSQGVPAVGLLLVALMGVTGVGIVRSIRREEGRQPVNPRFPIYLMLVGLQSALAYAFARCGDVSLFTIRYDLLSLLAPVGLVAWHLSVEPRRRWRAAAIVLVALWAGVGAIGHARLAAEYAHRPPRGPFQQVANALLARNIHYGRAGYWVAYHVTFITRERVILSSEDVPRITLYNAIVDAHPEAVTISGTPCGPNAEEIAEDVFMCRPANGELGKAEEP
ncbi:MAG: hypothetical protein HY701_08250 [Gemmatimonadetes bacterium]|nr:hypothetical protein [Gemmatimonadota bacterium]